MRLRLLLAWYLLAIGGCAWSPDRDNSVDPASSHYVPPRPPNHAPVIDTVFVVSDCWRSELVPFCWFDVVSVVTDVDGNLEYGLVTAVIDTFELGPMTFDPILGEFRVRRSQTDFPYEDLSNLIGKIVAVNVRDDSGASDVESVLFPTPLTVPDPRLEYPVGNSLQPVSIETDSVRLSWQLWTGSGGEHRFSISVFYKNIFLEWDTSGLMPSDTFVTITDTLQPAWIDQTKFYTWYLTVTDRLGNHLRSLPGYFRYLPAGRPPASRKSEFIAVE